MPRETSCHPTHLQQITVESADVPLSAASLQCIQQQSALLGRFENSVSRLAYTSAQKDQFEEKMQSRVEEISGLKNKLKMLESEFEADSNEKEISNTKSRISACETELGDLERRMKELEDKIEEESMQVKQDRNTFRIGTKKLLDQVVQQEIKRFRKEFLKRKEQADAKVRETELKLWELNNVRMGQSYPPSKSTSAQKVAVQQSSTELGPSLNTLPSLRDLLRELYLRADKWDSIGSLLDIDPNLLSKIKTDYGTNAGSCLREMLRIWLKRVSPPPSWSAIADAIEQLGESTFANQLRIKYLLSLS